jgi:glycosyltransferase involved in cell wall biosynthesis
MLYPWPEKKDFAACRNRYLWFGSAGLVHKGLDLVLEAFAEMPECHLTVCGPIGKEKDFVAAYGKELYQMPNIRTVGWVDIASVEFMEILQSCVGIVYPSCSEGGGGSVINCMHGGLIPILSYESSVDVEEGYGVILKESTVGEIKNSVRRLSALSPDTLENMARQSWEYARANHTREKFARTFREVIANIIGGGSAIPAPGESCFVEAAAEAVRSAEPDRRNC